MSKVALSSDDESKKNNTYNVLFKCLKTIILLIYPYTPFIAEELYLNLPEHLESVMLESYPIIENKFLDESGDLEINTLIEVIKEVRNYKITNKIAPNAKLDLSIKLKIDVDDDFITYLKRFTFSEISLIQGNMDNIQGDLINLDYCDLLISNNANADEVIARLKKDIEIEESEIMRCEKMLNNPNFISKAPAEKVEQEKSKLELHKNNLAELRQKLEKMIK